MIRAIFRALGEFAVLIAIGVIVIESTFAIAGIAWSTLIRRRPRT